MTAIGIGLSASFGRKRIAQLSDIPGLAWALDTSSSSLLYQDNPGTVLALLPGDRVKLANAALGSGSFSTGVDNDRATRVAWDSRQDGLFWSDASDLLDASAAILSSQNNVAGYTFACVVEMPPVLTTLRHILRITSSAGGAKFVLYQETNGRIYLSTRRIAADTTAAGLGDPATALTGGQRYVIIASVDYATGAGVIEVNGATTGLGISGTYVWSNGTGATCEAANPTIFTLSSVASPFTLGTIGDPCAFTRALTAAERSYARDILNSKFQVF